jgi:outer membrane protein OmpA-like peptidoglycan-associated protein
VRHRLARSFGVAVGGSRGVLPGLGAPSVRAFVLLAYTPGASELPAIVTGEPAKKVDTGDDDADSIINEYDRCPNEVEDYDDFEDEDGCPDDDNDGDGLSDDIDSCPSEAEDKDGYKDSDGCVDDDNDGDGIKDVVDECPMEVEDKDGYHDGDGCDDPDNDRDGIPDVIDQCALEAETINGRDDDDGCPDDGDSAVIENVDRIDLVESIRFRGNSAVLLKSSSKVLGQVGALLRARPEWSKIRIGVHVHPRGARDERLSLQRAEAVRTWLSNWGVDPVRLEVKGHGSSRPLVPRNARKARSTNDRVEFVVTEKTKPR